MTNQTENSLQQVNGDNENELPTTAKEALQLKKADGVINSGNPVFSCSGKVEVVADESERDPCYKQQHLLYQTSSNLYGELPATAASVPSTYHGKSQKFSQHLGECGMYRNHSLNTAMDKSKKTCKHNWNMFNFSEDCFSIDIFKENTLIIPAISVGNVGQLACDLIISSLRLERVGYFCPECFLPLVGNNPFANSKDSESIVSLNSEVYHNSEKKLTVLQIRSPLVKGKQEVFRKSLLDWIASCQFKELLILSSCHAYERTDEQLIGTPFRVLLNPNIENHIEDVDMLEWKKLEEKSTGFGDKTLFLPGGGFTKNLYKDSCSAGIPTAVLLVFCSEGDNIPEALAIVNNLNKWKHYLTESEKWKPPFSWKHLFGNLPPAGIF